MQKSRTEFTPPTIENHVVEQNGHPCAQRWLPSLKTQRKELMMPNAKLARAQRRHRMSELADPLDRITQADLNYFPWFSHRKYRLRVADPVEIELAELLGEDMSLPQGEQHYMVIYRHDPDFCARLPVTGPANAPLKLLHEELARAIFEENGEKPVPLKLMLGSIRA